MLKPQFNDCNFDNLSENHFRTFVIKIKMRVTKIEMFKNF